jgi:hypothetical protein
MDIPDDYVYLLPRGYLSWSAMDCWESSPERFKKEYFLDSEKLDTRYLQFGKKFAKSIEDGSYKSHIPDLVVYSLIEHELRVTVEGVPILGFIDSCHESFDEFREYKTGKHPWTQAKVQKHGQLVFYAVGIRAKTGEMPTKCTLDWIETAEGGKDSTFWEDKHLVFTGKLKSFERYFDVRELEAMEMRIKKNAYQISEAYREFINSI